MKIIIIHFEELLISNVKEYKETLQNVHIMIKELMKSSRYRKQDGLMNIEKSGLGDDYKM